LRARGAAGTVAAVSAEPARAPRRALRRLLAVALGAALCGAAGCGGPAKPQGDSLLLITIDTLRPDHLSAYGYARATSPRLDALAAAGTRFAEARSHVSMTGPSHASILTGTLPAWHRVYTNGDVLPAEIVTLADRLRAAGFATAGFVSNPTITRVTGFDQGFDHFDDTLPKREPNRPEREREAAQTIDAALGWLADHHRGRFFCWVHLEDPHGPYTPPAADAAPFLAAARALPPEPLPLLVKDEGGKGGIPSYQAFEGETNAHLYVARYDGEIHYADAQIGRLLDALAGWGVRPLVIVTADHGEAFGEHGYWFVHGQGLTEDQIRVPLILSGPGVPAGQVVTRPVQHVDVMPTALRWLGVAGASDLHGADLLVPGAPAPTVAALLPERWAIVDGGQALLAGPDGTRLYDLTRDPHETTDVSGAEPAARTRLETLLAAVKARPAPPWPERSARTELLREQLRALGYVVD
jgi:choline-sulfatase